MSAPVSWDAADARGRRHAGATLIELVVVIAVTSILAGGMAAFLVEPFRGYRDVVRRARLVDEAESALRRMARDVRRALPNSVRVAGGGSALEILYVADGARYRREPGDDGGPGGDHTAASAWLSFAAPPPGDDSWNVLGRFEALSFTYGVALPAGTRLAVYPTSSAVYSDAALGTSPGPGLITPASTQITVVNDGDEDQVQLTQPFAFRFESPRERLFVVQGPVSYLCDGAAGTLTRYAGYPIVQTQPTSGAAAPLDTAPSAALVSRRVASCGFVYQPGASQREALLTLELNLAEAGETVRLLHQIHVENAP